MTTDRKSQLGIMKAKPLTKPLLQHLGATCIVQRKLRGQRCRVAWSPDGLPILLSSYGIPFQFLEHIQHQLMAFDKLLYDGELYYHHPDADQQWHNSVLGRTENRHADCALIQFHCFDIINEDYQWFRLMQRDMALRTIITKQSCPIQVLPYETIQTKLWPEYCRQYLLEGYEGIILRDNQNTYRPLSPLEQAKRPSSMLKFKPNRKDTYRIVDYREGTGWAEGMLGGILLTGDDGDPFWVGSGLTKKQRQQYWSLKDRLVGGTATILHEGTFTRVGKPICTRIKEIVFKN